MGLCSSASTSQFMMFTMESGWAMFMTESSYPVARSESSTSSFSPTSEKLKVSSATSSSDLKAENVEESFAAILFSGLESDDVEDLQIKVAVSSLDVGGLQRKVAVLFVDVGGLQRIVAVLFVDVGGLQRIVAVPFAAISPSDLKPEISVLMWLVKCWNFLCTSGRSFIVLERGKNVMGHSSMGDLIKQPYLYLSLSIWTLTFEIILDPRSEEFCSEGNFIKSCSTSMVLLMNLRRGRTQELYKAVLELHCKIQVVESDKYKLRLISMGICSLKTSVILQDRTRADNSKRGTLSDPAEQIFPMAFTKETWLGCCWVFSGSPSTLSTTR